MLTLPLLFLFLTTAAVAEFLSVSSDNVLHMSTISPDTDGDGAPPLPLPYSFTDNFNPVRNETITSDSKSLFKNGKRFFPIGGEVHFARVPYLQWREELEKMKAGGLNTLSVYLFWIHHEEKEGDFHFEEQRDARAFLELADELDFMVLLRVGPWDHGEVRNGGHPDWVEEQSTKVRSADDDVYMGFVDKFFQRLAKELDGLWWHQGGPIHFCQLDNETGDWKYLSALHKLAVKYNFAPVSFTRTGWPALAEGAPVGEDFPLLPFFGGYPDYYWVNDMQPAVMNPTDPALAASYAFDNAQKPSNELFGGQDYFPPLNIETGGGMSVDYNHRVHMSSDDMPALHNVISAEVAGLGYYMYHGGVNPPSYEDPRQLDPSKSLTEGSWSSEGTQNGMNYIKYPYYCPIGENGQILKHYHSMRKLHTMIEDFAEQFSEAYYTSMPDIVPVDVNDTQTVRWAVRWGQESGEKWLFVNNHQRLIFMEDHNNIRFNVSGTLIPSALTEGGITIRSGTWFNLPVDVKLFNNTKLKYSTAQMQARLGNAIFFSKVDGINVVEFAFYACSTTIDACEESRGCKVHTEDALVIVVIDEKFGDSVFEKPAFTVNGKDVILLPYELSNGLWRGDYFGEEKVLINKSPIFENDEIEDNFLPADDGSISVRSKKNSVDFVTYPSDSEDTLFDSFHVDLTPTMQTAAKTCETNIVRPFDNPPRKMEIVESSGKPREPNVTEWETQAQVYDVVLPHDLNNSTDVFLLFDYVGDAARFCMIDKDGNKIAILDDYWVNYDVVGEFQVGLTFLNGKYNHTLFEGGVKFTLEILPIRKSSLEETVFIRDDLWPGMEYWSDIEGEEGEKDEFALKLNEVRILQTMRGNVKSSKN